jgi:hypothetical protein
VKNRVETASYRGWSSYRLSNDLVELHIVPDIGGRVIQFSLANHPFLFVNQELAGHIFPAEENGAAKDGWKNYGGSKLWPAPQGWGRNDRWPGPPDPVLDGGRYSGRIIPDQADPATEGAAVELISPPDPRTGVQLSRTVRLFAAGTQVRHTCRIRNISSGSVTWSIWEVVQLDTADPLDPSKFNGDFWAYCPLNPRSVHAGGFVTLHGETAHPSWHPHHHAGLFAASYDHRVGKVGLDSNAGWLAAVDARTEYCFVSRFNWFADRPYPDQSSVEFWLNGPGVLNLDGTIVTLSPDMKETPYYLETEILSPLFQLRPGQEAEFQIDWFAARCPNPVLTVTSAGCVSRPLQVSVSRNSALLQAVFGVFFPGRAEAVVLNAAGGVVAREDLGVSDPTRIFDLRHELALSAGAFRISLHLIDVYGQDRGPLGTVSVPH